MVPRARHNFLDARTVGYSLAILCVAWWIAGPLVAIPAGLIVYLLAALSPGNVSTCPWCGEGCNPQADTCRACGRPIR